MIDVGIAALANQSLSIQLDERFYEIELREANGVMSASITRDGVVLISNVRVTAGTPLLPYRYQEAGNFVMTTDGEAIPYWDQFGVTQFLVYLSAAEVAAYRGA
jgi:hypothetical protein